MSKAILTDVTKCIGCAQCVIACKTVNDLQPDNPRRWQKDDGLSADNWTSLLRKPDGHYVRKLCRHCLEPACVSACLVGAMRITEEGIVIYNKSICLGCRYCILTCPYGIPRYEWNQPVPYVRKCIMCYPRVKAGKQPACTEICPTGATIFGERDDLLETAHSRLQKHPDRYIQKIWGEKEIGGANVLYISDIDLSFLSYDKELDDKSLPDETKIAMNSVPFVFIGVGALMTGLHLFTQRKNRIAQQKRQKEGNEDE